MNTEKKILERYRPQDISLAGLIWYIFIAIFSIVWISYLAGISYIFTIGAGAAVLWFIVAWVIGYFCILVYSAIYRSVKAPRTPDGKYGYYEKADIKSINYFELHTWSIKTRKKTKTVLPFPEKLIASYRELFGKRFNWWVVLENTDSTPNYQFIATIGIWDLKKPHRLLEYAVNIEKGISTLIRDYIENPEVLD